MNTATRGRPTEGEVLTEANWGLLAGSLDVAKGEEFGGPPYLVTANQTSNDSFKNKAPSIH
jgi:hypothetical protein